MYGEQGKGTYSGKTVVKQRSRLKSETLAAPEVGCSCVLGSLVHLWQTVTASGFMKLVWILIRSFLKVKTMEVALNQHKYNHLFRNYYILLENK